MTSRNRPLGLTGLALFNFYLAVIFAIGLVAYLDRADLVQKFTAATASLSDIEQQQAQALMGISTLGYYMLAVLIAVGVVLLISSGAGYLRLKRFLGRTVGNVAALTLIVCSVAVAFWLPEELDGGLNGFTAINFTYPLLMLYLMNVTFKDKLVN